ncbi:hypothetical protein C798_25400 [Herbaspirillum rubrisubalbicans Os34]|uniref:Uncharacterized protein n=1 Tax=Herbaspirillum rubrisubalbicans Os34 TaxID=1235827 RepID=A0A6M3ZZZ1_9BURK|nr:hypothetical protein [Herbaspirillum rubrisubalbicans]QJQ03450.1 hypothetical protein C798_25400 [Herbaspirillum rubrisubalbicans Os34]
MKADDIVDVCDFLNAHGLSSPDLEVLRATERSYRALLLQPAGPFIGNEARIGPADLDFADRQASALFEMATKLGHHLVVTPEYYLPIKTLLDCVQGDRFPAPDAIWVLGCESMTPAQLADFKASAEEAGNCRVFYEADEAAAAQGIYFDPLAYCFRSKDKETGEDQRVILIQFKTISSKDDQYFENGVLRTGKVVYQFRGLDKRLSLSAIICSDAFNIAADNALLLKLTENSTLLHIQLNPKPRNTDYLKYRVDTFRRHPRTNNCDIVCLNWAENNVFLEKEGGKEHPWNNEAGSAWYLPDDRASSDDALVEQNERKGLYYSWHRRHRHVLHFHYAPAVFEFSVPKVEHTGLQLHVVSTGPKLEARYVWHDANGWCPHSECADTGLAQLFQRDPNVTTAFAALAKDESRLRIERAVAICCGITSGADDWYSVRNLRSLVMNDDEVTKRLTVRLERNEESEKGRHDQLQGVSALHEILATTALPLQIRDLSGGGAEIFWSRQSPHTNVVKGGVEPAHVAFLGFQPEPKRIENACDSAYALLHREDNPGRRHRVAVCYSTLAGPVFAPIRQLTHIVDDGKSPTSFAKA